MFYDDFPWIPFVVIAFVTGSLSFFGLDYGLGEKEMKESTVVSKEYIPAWTETKRVYDWEEGEWETKRVYHAAQYIVYFSDGWGQNIRPKIYGKCQFGTKVFISRKIGWITSIKYDWGFERITPKIEN